MTLPMSSIGMFCRKGHIVKMQKLPLWYFKPMIGQYYYKEETRLYNGLIALLKSFQNMYNLSVLKLGIDV